MDKKIEQKIKEAQEKAKAEAKRKLLAEDPENKEFWENKIKNLEQTAKNLKGQLAEINLVIECYKKKISDH
jgi:hypothetical protein